MRSFLLFGLLAVGVALAAPADPTEPSFDNAGAHAWFTDVPLVDQHGKTWRLYSDLIRGKVVIISSFFSSCEASCPVTNHNLQEIQRSLGPSLGRDVLMLSITLDPVNDTPEKLAKYAEQFGAQRGWYFLTGKPADVALALQKTGQQVQQKEDHMALFYIGNDKTGLWKKAFGMAPLADLMKIIESVRQNQL